MNLIYSYYKGVTHTKANVRGANLRLPDNQQSKKIKATQLILNAISNRWEYMQYVLAVKLLHPGVQGL
jgi:hypothetical protein